MKSTRSYEQSNYWKRWTDNSIILQVTQSYTKYGNNKLSILSGHRYLTDAELAKCLKISRRTLQEYRNNGIIPFYHVGGKILYKEADIEEFLETNRQEAIE